jgi:hypothetical protein
LGKVELYHRTNVNELIEEETENNDQEIVIKLREEERKLERRILKEI